MPARDVLAAAQSRAMKRAALYLLALSGGAGAVIGIVFPESGAGSMALRFAPAIGCLALGAVVVVFFERLPLVALELVIGAATALTSVSIAMGSDRAAGAEFFYLWAVLYAAVFFTRRGLAFQLALAAGAYAGALALNPPAGHPVARWSLTVLGLGAAAALVVVLRSSVEALVERLADLAQTDPLTSLLNRRGFYERLEIEVERSRRHDTPLAVAVGDLDGFKRINDELGHAAGDAALVRLGVLLRDEVRLSDAVARTGGEEVSLVMPDTSPRGALVLIERVRSRIEHEYRSDGIALTMSFGIAGVPEHGAGGEQALRAADEALYAAKQSGRNRVLVHSHELAEILDARRRDPQARLQLETAVMLAEALDLRDPSTARHSQTVARYAELMAAAGGLPVEHVERVRLAGLVHDVGKIGVSDATLRKAGPLTEDEWVEMRRHPELGARLLTGDALADIRSWVVAHHECPDGRGYPRGLAGEAIPLEARILAVADAYEAMTADRPYRLGMSRDAAEAELERGGGKQFDAAITELFLRSLAAMEAAPSTSG